MERRGVEWEKLLDDVLLTSEFAWWEWEIGENRVHSNDRKVEMLGYPPERFRGAGYQAFTDLLHPEDYERTMQAMRDHLEGRAPLYQIDYRIKREDGRYTWFMDRGRIIERDGNGTPLRLRGIVIDLGPEIEEKAGDGTFLEALRTVLPSPGAMEEKRTVVCSGCRKLKTGGGEWVAVDAGFHKALSGEVSHGICPGCVRELYPDEADQLLGT